MERLQRVLARAGVASRRHSADIIRQGRVQVDGVVIREPGARVDPSRAKVSVDGRPITIDDSRVYYLLNKPAGYISTARDPQGRPTVLDLVPRDRHRLFPVGRLDFDTEGLILLTNDGDAAYALTHPAFEVPKTYIAQVRGVPGERALEALRGGVRLGDVVTSPARVRLLRSDSTSAVIEVEIHEGRKREVRNMLAAVGHPVLHLRRTRLGRLVLGDLKVGSWRRLTPDEVRWVQTLAAKAAGRAGRSKGPGSGDQRQAPVAAEDEDGTEWEGY
ncbi:MAG: rRNA pseudouridine synthase [Firmicutes bacterium]|jgi:pseudouridine synthase|nr:rRNA pseudouridine synthase [Bacillota bacterium]MDH7495550.1 pseudouridine synthase [Bacillota bacterium]